MEFRELGKSGIKVSAIGLGTWQWGSREWGWGRHYGKKDVLDAFEKAIELGINFVDTAEVYGRGQSEELLGEAIQGHKEDVVIATKVSPWNLTNRRVQKAAHRSLQRLGVDVIDLYQVHWPNPVVPIRGTMKAMRRLVQDGSVRCVGVSNFRLGKMKAAQGALAPMNLVSNQVKYNVFDRGIESDVLPYAKSEGISIIAYSPLAQGLLTGKYSEKNRPSSFVQKMNSKFSSNNLRRLGQFQQILSTIAQTYGKTPSQIALNWLLRQENVVAIPGIKKPDHVVDNAGAMGWRLADADAESLERAASEIRFDRISALPSILRAVMK